LNLEDVLNEDGLQQDEWSLTTPTFGEHSQIKVIGWSGKSFTNKYYILKCDKCSQDNELFGEGYFKALKTSFTKGYFPCGCGPRSNWTESQYKTLCTRRAQELGYTFVEFKQPWNKGKTKLILSCDNHGEWLASNYDNMNSRKASCPVCLSHRKRALKLKPDCDLIETFFDSGCFHSETEFWRSDRKDTQGKRNYWVVYCPECGEQGESTTGNLQKGKRCCACSNHRQKEAYIHWVLDDNYSAVAIKFGIATNSHRRRKQQDSKSLYNVQHFIVYTFPTVEDCKKAERECKQEFECGLLKREDMCDGYTETTGIGNFLKVIEIYARNQGVCTFSI